MLPLPVPISHAAKATEYVSHGAAEYAAEGGHAPSEWLGRGAQALGLVGKVDPQHLSNLLRGLSPDGQSQLLARPAKDTVVRINGRQKVRKTKLGFELVFHPPKSVSIAAIKDPRIAEWVFEAGRAAVRRIDRASRVTDQSGGRKGARGAKPSDGLAVAMFQHFLGRPSKEGASRDPGLHLHVMIANLARDAAAQRWRAIYAHNIVSGIKQWDSIFLQELSRQLVAGGYALENARHGFEIAGIPESLREYFGGVSKAKKPEIERRTALALAQKTEIQREAALARALQANGWKLESQEVVRRRPKIADDGRTVRSKNSRPKFEQVRQQGWTAYFADGRTISDITNPSAPELKKLTAAERQVVDHLRRKIAADPTLEATELTKAEKVLLRNEAFRSGRVAKTDTDGRTPKERLATHPDRQRVYDTVRLAQEAAQRRADERATEGTSRSPASVIAGTARDAGVESRQAQVSVPDRTSAAPTASVTTLPPGREMLRLGLRVRPSDRNNLGKIIGLTSDGRVLVRFESPEGRVATVPFTYSQLRVLHVDGSDSPIAADGTFPIATDDGSNLLPRPLDRDVGNIEAGSLDLKESVDWVLRDVFERVSTAELQVLVDAVSRRALGTADKSAITAALYSHPSVVIRNVKKRGELVPVATSLEVIAEERAMLQLLNRCRGACLPFGEPQDETLQRKLHPSEEILQLERERAALNAQEHLSSAAETKLSELNGKLRQAGVPSPEQRQAILAFLTTSDRVHAFRGLPGTGKTFTLSTLEQCLHTFQDAVADSGYRIVACAPSGEASRGRLREAGFKEAETLAAILTDARAAAEGSKPRFNIDSRTVLMLDEAGMAGTSDVLELIQLAETKGARVLLVGDDRQLTPVGRGDAFRSLLGRRVGASELSDIRRQDGNWAYKQAVRLMSEGKITEGLERMRQMGAVVVIKNEQERYSQMAADALAADAADRRHLTVCAEHREIEQVHSHTRAAWKGAGRIEGPTLVVNELRSTHDTAVRREDWRYYQPTETEENGQKVFRPKVVEFHHREGRLWKNGSRWIVTRAAEDGVYVRSADPKGDQSERLLPHEKYASSFDICRQIPRELAKGDVVRWTGKAKTESGGLMSNGITARITEVDLERRRLTMDNGETVALAECEKLTYGYAATTYIRQGQTKPLVFVHLDGRASRSSGSIQQILVAASRGELDIRIYTDDWEDMVCGVKKTSHRMTAAELYERAVHVQTREQLPAAEAAFQALGRTVTEAIATPSPAQEASAILTHPPKAMSADVDGQEAASIEA